MGPYHQYRSQGRSQITRTTKALFFPRTQQLYGRIGEARRWQSQEWFWSYGNHSIIGRVIWANKFHMCTTLPWLGCPKEQPLQDLRPRWWRWPLWLVRISISSASSSDGKWQCIFPTWICLITHSIKSYIAYLHHTTETRQHLRNDCPVLRKETVRRIAHDDQRYYAIKFTGWKRK